MDGDRYHFPIQRMAVPAAFAFALFHSAMAFATGPDTEFFEKKIRPVLAESCFECHSGQAKELKGNLRLDSAEALKTGGETGPVLAPGAPEKSRLIEAIRYQDPDLQMPPKGRLSADKIEDLTNWVRQGAPGRNPGQRPVAIRRQRGPENRTSTCSSAKRRIGRGSRSKRRLRQRCSCKRGPLSRSIGSC